MLRLLARILGFLALCAGMAAGVYDGARSIADDGFRLVSLGEAALRLHPRAYATLETAAARLPNWLWDPLLLGALQAPAVMALFALGTALLLVGRPKRTAIAPPD